jgi:hypothetical protein
MRRSELQRKTPLRRTTPLTHTALGREGQRSIAERRQAALGALVMPGPRPAPRLRESWYGRPDPVARPQRRRREKP